MSFFLSVFNNRSVWLAAEYGHQRWCLQTVTNWGQSIYSLHFMGQTSRMKLYKDTDILRGETEYLIMSSHVRVFLQTELKLKNMFDNGENGYTYTEYRVQCHLAIFHSFLQANTNIFWYYLAFIKYFDKEVRKWNKNGFHFWVSGIWKKFFFVLSYCSWGEVIEFSVVLHLTWS